MKTTEFLDIVAIIKDGDKYTARIAELKAMEDRLADKLAIANSVEKAVEMQEQAAQMMQQLEDQARAQKTAYEARMADLEKQFNARMGEVSTKWESLTVERMAVRKAKEEAMLLEMKASREMEVAKAMLAEANEKVAMAKEKEAKVVEKMAKLKEAMGE